jgi:hypothetical protein
MTLRSALRPLRLLAGRFVLSPMGATEAPIFFKAAHITSAEQVEGDYLEFGTYQGNSLIRAYGILRQVYEERYRDPDNIHSPEYRARVRELWEKMRFFAFDSFQGLPPVTGSDVGSMDFVEGKFRCSQEAFLENLRSHSIDLGKVVPVPGWFENTCTGETLRKYGMRSASIIHFDCDLYESTRTALKFIEPLLVDGTVLVFDDWYCFRGNPGLGEQRAFREWSKGMDGWVFTEYQKEGPMRNSFIASRVK